MDYTPVNVGEGLAKFNVAPLHFRVPYSLAQLSCHTACLVQKEFPSDPLAFLYGLLFDSHHLAAGYVPPGLRDYIGVAWSDDYEAIEEEALKEAEEFHGIEIDDYRVLSFKPGYYSAPWQNNCVSIGLSYSFIEPLEATTISIGIQQAKLLCSFLANYSNESKYMQEEYNRVMKDVMENAVSMISLHYMSDREDTQMWKDQKTAQKPDLLKRLLRVWSERLPEYQDVPSNHFELFGTAHLWHVAQGQGILNKDLATAALNAYGSRLEVAKSISDNVAGLLKVGLIDHAESLRRTKNS